MKSGLVIFAVLLLASAAFAGVTVTADDGAVQRVDVAKLARLTESAMRHAGAD